MSIDSLIEDILCRLSHILTETNHYLPMQSGLLRDALSDEDTQDLICDYFSASREHLQELIRQYQSVLCFLTPERQKFMWNVLQTNGLTEQMEFSIRMEIKSKVGDLIPKVVS